MAGSRLEKIGTIYTRFVILFWFYYFLNFTEEPYYTFSTSGLIQSKALNWEDRPIWYDVYAAFPPKEEPRFDRPAPNIKLRQIFYEDDKIRA